jgi:hypothetical protein
MERIACVDFDGTITHFSFPEMGEPQPGVRENLQKLKDMGYTIHIYSCRTNIDLYPSLDAREKSVQNMKDYLDEHEIPYDKVLCNDKPLAIWYIDDRSIGFRGNWEDVIKEISYYEK